MAKLFVVLLLLMCYTSVQARVTCVKTYKGRLCTNTNSGEISVKRHYKESGITTFTPLVRSHRGRTRSSIQTVRPHHSR